MTRRGAEGTSCAPAARCRARIVNAVVIGFRLFMGLVFQFFVAARPPECRPHAVVGQRGRHGPHDVATRIRWQENCAAPGGIQAPDNAATTGFILPAKVMARHGSCRIRLPVAGFANKSPTAGGISGTAKAPSAGDDRKRRSAWPYRLAPGSGGVILPP